MFSWFVLLWVQGATSSGNANNGGLVLCPSTTDVFVFSSRCRRAMVGDDWDRVYVLILRLAFAGTSCVYQRMWIILNYPHFWSNRRHLCVGVCRYFAFLWRILIGVGRSKLIFVLVSRWFAILYEKETPKTYFAYWNRRIAEWSRTYVFRLSKFMRVTLDEFRNSKCSVDAICHLEKWTMWGSVNLVAICIV